jgi:hydrogenase nickel incorporation protein HypB
MHGVKILPVYGGQDISKQIRGLRDGTQVIVGTPGRVMDHMRRGTVKFENARFCVLDEADEMLDMGFIDDMKTILSSGTHAVQLHTGGMCHLDAEMSRQGLLSLTKNEDYDELSGSIVFLENVGNLVCPAEFDTGAHLDLVILSVPEGDDKPLKYPLVFEKTDAVLINKIDAESAFDFSRERVLENIRKRNEKEEVFFISAKTGEGIEAAAQFISKEAGKLLDQ